MDTKISSLVIALAVTSMALTPLILIQNADAASFSCAAQKGKSNAWIQGCKGGWFDHVKLEDVTGSCYMIDFPLNARYNAIQKKSFNVFAGAGLSSYLMKKEEYSYYGYYYGNPINSNREYEGSEGYILSILNVSVGYEKKLSNSFSMQVEPFFKQTLKGVGFGDISLSSTGVYFSLRYNPVKIQHTNKTASK